MILARNRPQRLSGNKICIALLFILALTGCTTKRTTVLRSPESEANKQQTSVSKPEVEEDKVLPTKMGSIQQVNGFAVKNNKIALLLPFELNRVASRVTTEDVKRSSLALDFYQGFQMGLDQLSTSGLNSNYG